MEWGSPSTLQNGAPQLSTLRHPAAALQPLQRFRLDAQRVVPRPAMVCTDSVVLCRGNVGVVLRVAPVLSSCVSALTAATEPLECLALHVKLPYSIDYTAPFRRCTLLEERTQHAAAMLVSTAPCRGYTREYCAIPRPYS
jgi:hypothetical protein